MGEKSAEKLIKAIAQSKNQPWSRVLYGLGIRHVGSVNAQLLTEKFTTVEELTAARQSDIAGLWYWCRNRPISLPMVADSSQSKLNIPSPGNRVTISK
jgi:NAD-dependent DNA ligase